MLRFMAGELSLDLRSTSNLRQGTLHLLDLGCAMLFFGLNFGLNFGLIALAHVVDREGSRSNVVVDPRRQARSSALSD